MAKVKTVFICEECGYESPRWLGRCPDCQRFNTMAEQLAASALPAVGNTSASTFGSAGAVTLKQAATQPEHRFSTGLSELDRVLSGGIVNGSLVLVGGDPGIGKSTMLLQVCQGLGEKGKKILYVSGEESVQQIKMRAERLGVTTEALYLLSETSMDAILHSVNNLKPDLLIVDSIQTMQNTEMSSVPGSVSQVRECTQSLMRLAKGQNVAVVIVGHVTKEGNIAGPRVLEHMVDTVLYFEGERREMYRVVRAVKNRFGGTDEIGVFEMRDKGLVEIQNPSAYMLNGRPLGSPGSVVTCSMEGTRPILAEIQALVCHTSFGIPRRTATGADYNRVVMLMAVLEKRAKLPLGTFDSYVNVAGGMKIVEPAVDAAVALAIASSYKNKAADPYSLVLGEVGLTGELRAVTSADKRVAEAKKLGFKTCVLPQSNLKGLKKPADINVYGAANLFELLELSLNA